MKKISLIILLFTAIFRLSAQSFPAEGIGYQAMLSKPDRVTYGTTLKNIPIANTDIKVRFELTQTGVVLLTDEHTLTTNVNGIFACIIGTGKTTPFGIKLSQLDWAKDSVMVNVYVNPGDGEFLFSQQKLWSTAYALHSATSYKALNDNDTSATNELQFLILSGDSVKLTQVPGGISLKPWSDGIAKNSADITAEKNRAEAAEVTLKSQIDAVDDKYSKASDDLRDSLSKHRTEINKNTADITTLKSENVRQEDSLKAHRVELNANRSDINKNSSDIVSINSENTKQNDSLVALRTAINKNAADIKTINTENSKQNDSIAAHRTAINKNAGDIISINAENAKQNDSLAAHRTAINKNAADIALHNANDKDTSATNELTDLSYNATTKDLTLTNPKTAANKVNLAALQDNLGNHTATENVKLNGNYLSHDGGNEGIYVDESGRIGVNTKNVDTSLSMDLTKTTRPIGMPVLTTTQRNAITNAPDGSVIYNSSTKKAEVYIKGADETQTNIYGGEAFDGPIHGQTFQTTSGGRLSEVQVYIAPRTSTPLAIVCKLYEGLPGTSASYICDADSAITCYNPTGATFATPKNAVYTFNTAKPLLQVGKTYYLEFSNGTSSQFWFHVSNHNGCYVADQITTGEYYSGSSMSNVAARTNSCYYRDLKGYIKIQSPSIWEPLNEGFNIADVDASETNELQDLVYNSTTKKLSLSPAKTTGNEIDLSAIGGSDNLGDHKATQNINLNGKYLSGDGDNEGVFVNSSGNVGLGLTNPEFSLHSKGPLFTEATFNSYSHNSSASMGAILRSQSVSGVANFTQLISRGTSSGNWSSGIEFLNQSSGSASPVVNLKINPNGTVEMPNGTLKVGTVTYPNAHNSTANQVLTINSSGVATWQSPASGSGDNLGNHTATANLKMSNRWLSNDGDNEGVYVKNDGLVGVNVSSPEHQLHSRYDMFVGAHPSIIASSDTFLTRFSRTAAPGLLFYPEMTQKDQEGGVNCRIMALGNASGNWSSGISFYTMQDGSSSDIMRKAMVISRYQRVGIGSSNPSAFLHITQPDYYKWWNPTSSSAITIEDTSGTNQTKFDILVGYRSNGGTGVANTITFDINGSGNFYFGDNVLPNSDNSVSLGATGARWSAVWSANGTIQTSDIREKKNVANLNYGINDLMKLRPVSYNWKNEVLGTERKIGFIAQELQKVLPETVQGSEADGLLGVNYGEITSLTVKAIQEQQLIIEKQQKQIEALLIRIEALEKK
jgi:hypothetical protein